MTQTKQSELVGWRVRGWSCGVLGVGGAEKVQLFGRFSCLGAGLRKRRRSLRSRRRREGGSVDVRCSMRDRAAVRTVE